MHQGQQSTDSHVINLDAAAASLCQFRRAVDSLICECDKAPTGKQTGKEYSPYGQARHTHPCIRASNQLVCLRRGDCSDDSELHPLSHGGGLCQVRSTLAENPSGLRKQYSLDGQARHTHPCIRASNHLMSMRRGYELQPASAKSGAQLTPPG